MPKDAKNFPRSNPEDVWKWKLLEEKFAEVFAMHDYQEIRLPLLQDRDEIHSGITAMLQSENAQAGVDKTIHLCTPDGATSQMSLRPEGTISILHHTARIFHKGDIHRFYYHSPMFRQGKDGHPEEFSQLGVELLGSNSILTENEIISMGMRILREFGLVDASVKLNSYGCENCRRKFFADMHSYLDEHANEFCQLCLAELYANPFADTHCRSKSCSHHTQAGPQIHDYICDKCKANLNKIKKIQANLTNKYSVDQHLYKNFAYYNETVFDFVVKHKGKELLIGGGGRYDYLSAKITRKRIPAVGFSLDLDAIFQVMNERSLFQPAEKQFTVYICAQSPDLEMMLLQIAQELHSDNIKTVLSADNNSTETELANARRLNCDIMIVLRDDNIREGKLLLRNMTREDQSYIPLNQITDSLKLARKSLKKD